MYQAQFEGQTEIVDQVEAFGGMEVVIKVQPDHQVAQYFANLAPDVAWGNRQIAARKLGNMRNPEALHALADALPADPFWMVRCEIIQALEKIGDPRAIPTLRQVAKEDSFQFVRGYAAKAIERLYEKV